jgi:hypothetical protein
LQAVSASPGTCGDDAAHHLSSGRSSKRSPAYDRAARDRRYGV